MRSGLTTLPGRCGVLALLACASTPAQARRWRPEELYPPRLTTPAQATKPPFRARRRSGVKGLHGKDQGLIDLSRWPADPESPNAVDPTRLSSALQELCRGLEPSVLDRYAGWIVRYAGQFDVDPFLLAAVVYRQSRCRADTETDFGVGLTRVHPRMHAPFLRAGMYRYWVLDGNAWSERTLDMPRFRFTLRSLRKPERSLYFGAALLAVHKAQCPHNDGVFGSVPHRHYVSHFAWGDRVRGAGAEDRTLRARRRLLRYYAGRESAPVVEVGGQRLISPLDGGPRKVTSVVGAGRDGGKREHKGIDFESDLGEPVRSIADGVVVMAGLDRKHGSGRILSPEAAAQVPPSTMGPGGLYVLIDHDNGLRSAYMHLQSYRVRIGRRVAAGEQIGRVGRTGIRTSGAHLHFELRRDKRHVDPMPILAPLVFELDATWWGRRVAIDVARKRRARRRAAWRARRRAPN